MPKRPAMFGVMLGSWILCLLYFNPRLLALLIGPEPFIAKFCLLLFILGLDLFWFYAFFHLVIVGFSYFKPSDNLTSLLLTHPPTTLPKVALLYATCHDFREEAVYSHLHQDYPNYHLFILDDSSDQAYQKRIDEFAKNHLNRITVIRRNNRVGFKAGNLNHALNEISPNYEYFSVSDADTLLPPNYISALLVYALNPTIAFAQAAQKTSLNQKTNFARFMGLNTDIHFRRYASTKNQYGFVMWYGHGALLRRDIWEQVGGFPEIVTEDLAYSMQAREAGYAGVFVEDVVCEEDFPPTYQQYRKRNEKWIRGTAECLLKFYPSFVKSARISWIEKMDVLVSGLSLLTALPFLFFLLLSGIVLPLFFTHFQFLGPMFRAPILYDKNPLAIVTQLRGNLFWSWDVFLLMVASVFAPLVPACIDYRRHPRVVMRYLSTYIFCFFSLQVASAMHSIVVLVTGKAVFPVTGECARQDRQNVQRIISQAWARQAHANLAWIFLLEVIAGLVFWGIGAAAHNIWFLPVACALLLSPCVFKWNFNSWMMEYAAALPFVITLGIIYFIGKGLPGL
ncbi:MAG: glycosyltransferase [Candidatus Omnitrophica bacterium]|nr:glycosyltransferase [Candidatus Omnitrophota bacterium]